MACLSIARSRAPTRHLKTARLVPRPSRFGDDAAAHAKYGAPEVARRLCPALPAVRDRSGIRRTVGGWITDRDAVGLPELIGGVALMPLSPDGVDLEIRWQVHPTKWRHGYGAEIGHAVAHQAVEDAGISEGPVLRRGNCRG
jgi:RimJ/RimL family protein N-acetyltransferase